MFAGSVTWYIRVADPDVEPRVGVAGGGGGGNLLALLAFLPSVISSLFTQNKIPIPPLDPPLHKLSMNGIFHKICQGKSISMETS